MYFGGWFIEGEFILPLIEYSDFEKKKKKKLIW